VIQSTRKLSFVALVCALVIVLAVPAGAITEKQWRTKADAACTQSNAQVDAAITQLGLATTSNPTAEEVNAVATVVAPLFSDLHDTLEAIPVPSSIKAKVKKLLKSFQRGIDELESAQFASAQEFSQALLPSSKQAQKLGLKVCGN
jgi:hypothetical protein